MANVYNILINNPYREIVIETIQYFNAPNKRPVNPFEKLMIASLFVHRSIDWLQEEGDWISKKLMCECPNDYGGVTVAPCPFHCEGDPLPCHRIVNPIGPIKEDTLASEFLVMMANNVGLPNPLTVHVIYINDQLNNIRTNGVNDYTYFQQAVDTVFANIDFISYFTNEYYNGKYANTFLAMFSGNYQKGVYTNGLLVNTITEGTPVATKAVTTITTDTVVPETDQSTWFEVYSDNTNKWDVWLNINDAGIQPVVATPPGVTEHYVQVAVGAGDTAEQIATKIANAMTTAPGFAFESVIAVGTDVTITRNATGSIAPSLFDNLPAHDLWAGVFVDGTSSTGDEERFEITYNLILESSYLHDRYFTLYDGVTSHMFWYDCGTCGGTEPTEPADFYHVITIADNVTTADIKSITDAAILDTGFWNIIESSEFTTIWENNTPGETTNINGGTAAVGDGGVTGELIAPDGTVFPGDYSNPLDYMEGWNSLVVTHQASINQPTYYIKLAHSYGPKQPFIVNGLSVCYVCVGVTPPSGHKIIWLGNCGTETERYGYLPVFIKTPYEANVERILFR